MPALLVPISLDLLMVRIGSTAEDWADIAMRKPRSHRDRRVRQQLESEPFANRAGDRPPGAYLHWALPDALACGKSNHDGLIMPVVPDRWLILRLSTLVGSATRNVDAWLIPDAGAAQPRLIADVLKTPAAVLPPATGEMTILGPGSFSWAACYDNVANRFAMHDDLAGVEGAVAYLICGWYTNRDQDPVAVANDSAFLDRLEDCDWSLARPLRSCEERPDHCVFHAVALGHGWPNAEWTGGGIGYERDMRPDSAAIQISLGETLAEAVVAASTDDLDQATARLLEARLTGILGDPSGVDGATDLISSLNAARFASSPGETKRETIWQAGGDGDLSGSFRQVDRAGPRSWQAVNPSIVLQGAGRSGRHGCDGRFAEENDLVCRLEADVITAFGLDGRLEGRGVDALPPHPLAALPAIYGAPAILEGLLAEAASLDPGSAPDLPGNTSHSAAIAQARARWWQSFADEEIESDALQGSRIEGILPSPIAICTPCRPWNPVLLDWQIAYLPSPHGAHDWLLGNADFTLPAAPAMPDVSAILTFSGRCSLNSSPARMLESLLEDREDVAAPMFDLIGGSLEGFIASLRGDPLTSVISEVHGTLNEPMPLGERPSDFQPLRAGFLRIDRLRVIDGFGRFADLPLRSQAVALGRTLATPGHSDLAAMRPRFTAPARVRLRFTDAAGSGSDADPATSPICGYVLPATNDTSLEIFDADGTGLGRLRQDVTQGIAWEESPGTYATLGARPDQHIGNGFLAGLANALFAADTKEPNTTARASVLGSLLRIIDATRWSTDVTGPAGEEHLSLLLGQPVAIVRATIRLDVDDERKPPENAITAIPVRLGSLAQLGDGLLGYFIDDDYSVLRIIDPAVVRIVRELDIAPLEESYVDDSGVFYINPGIDIPLTLIMVPGASVQVTTGVLPQKQVNLLREWTAPALSRLSPTLRFGPLLRDDPITRIPVASDIRGDWLWHRHPDPTTWATDKVVPANTAAQLPNKPVSASDGWLQIKLLPDLDYPEGQIGTRIRYVVRDRNGTIRKVGGRNEDGSIFMMPTGQAARLHESGRFRFYIQQDGEPDPTPVIVVTRRDGRKYLRSKADRSHTNNLLNLPPPPIPVKN
jgi:hypothetical protein